ncbi:hypothetical protein ABPG72_006355 [Tetrahymena utriculariae]
MGSCLSNDKKPDDKEELSYQENKQTKTGTAFQRSIEQKSVEERIELVQSSELTEFLKLQGTEQKDSIQQTIEQIASSDNDQLLKYIRSVMAKLTTLKEKSLPVSNPNHSQFASIIHEYSLVLETPLLNYQKGKNQQVSILKQSFIVSLKTLHILLSLQDGDLNNKERWWGTGTDYSQIFQEMKQCVSSYDANVKKIANDYLSELYGNLNIGSEKGDLPSQVLREYFPKLYKQTIDSVVSRH